MTTASELRGLLRRDEGLTLEFKHSRILSDTLQLAKILTAFANAEGGILLIGIRDDKSIEGMKAKRGHEEHIMNIASDRCDPGLAPRFQKSHIRKKGDVYVISVPKSQDLYHAAKWKDGYKFFVRVGSTIREIPPSELRIPRMQRVEYDTERRVYGLTHSKRVFKSEHDYEISLKHARRLTLSSRDSQRLDLMSPNAALDLLVFESENDVDNQCFVQHLRTGYRKDAYSLMEKYRRLMNATGLSKIPSIPKLGLTGSTWAELTHMAGVDENISERDFENQIPTKDIEPKSGKFKIQVSPFFSAHPPEYVYVDQTRMRETLNLRDQAIEAIYSIVNDVINGIPLEGFCEHCPNRRITIESKP